MMQRAKIRPHEHPRHHAIFFRLGKDHALQLREWHLHRIDFFQRRHGRWFSRLSLAFIRGLTSALKWCDVIPGWSEGPDLRCALHIGESKDSPMCNCTSEVRAPRAPE